MFQRWIGIVAGLALLAPVSIYGSVFGTVKVIVHDPQHRPVNGAQVVVQSRTSAFKQAGATDDEGIATLLNLPVGEYDVKITAQGFANNQLGVVVNSDRVQELHFALSVASHQETVEVSGTAELVNPTSSTPQTVVSRTEIA